VVVHGGTRHGFPTFSLWIGEVAMTATTSCPARRRLLVALGVACLLSAPALRAGPKPEFYWRVDDVRTGMKGHGRTVMRGTKVENFQAEVLGVLKNTSPGRDLVLCRL